MPINVDSMLRAHSYMRTARPPEAWDLEADDETFFHLLGEMIVAGMHRGNELGDLTLSVANVTVLPGTEGPIPEARAHVEPRDRGVADAIRVPRPRGCDRPLRRELRLHAADLTGGGQHHRALPGRRDRRVRLTTHAAGGFHSDAPLLSSAYPVAWRPACDRTAHD
jgi:hypothetical protein